jgi:hypothetical protein
MNIWLIVSLIGFILVLSGFVVFQRNYIQNKQISNSVIFLGIFIPMLFALFYSETLIELIPQITMIDLGAFYIIGMISGFFISILLNQRKSHLQGN